MVNQPGNPLQRRMRARLRDIAQAYDFQTFTLPNFAAWLAAQRGRALNFVPFALPAPLFGAWLQGADQDFIFYAQDAAPLHQAHIQLHELAHILCEHPTLTPGTPEGNAFIALLTLQTPDADAPGVALRLAYTEEQEREAETLAALIQQQVLAQAGRERLVSAPSSNGTLDAYLRSLQLT